MKRKPFDDRTNFKHYKTEKAQWDKAAKIDTKGDLSKWMRKTLNDAASSVRYED